MPDEEARRPQIEEQALRVLYMVHELHKHGYQRLRIVPGDAPSGCYWRCSVTPITNTLTTHGAMSLRFDECIHYSTGMEGRFFQWIDAEDDTARQLAAKFRERFPEVVRLGHGSDWPYAGWFVEMLGFAEQGHFPVAYADWYGEPPPYLASDGDRTLPFPPPGEAVGLPGDEV